MSESNGGIDGMNTSQVVRKLDTDPQPPLSPEARLFNNINRWMSNGTDGRPRPGIIEFLTSRGDGDPHKEQRNLALVVDSSDGTKHMLLEVQRQDRTLGEKRNLTVRWLDSRDRTNGTVIWSQIPEYTTSSRPSVVTATFDEEGWEKVMELLPMEGMTQRYGARVTPVAREEYYAHRPDESTYPGELVAELADALGSPDNPDAAKRINIDLTQGVWKRAKAAKYGVPISGIQEPSAEINSAK